VALWDKDLAPLSAFKSIGDSVSASSTMISVKNIGIDLHYIKEIASTSLFNFQVFLILGMVLGAFVAAVMSGKFKFTSEVPELFKARFGDKVGLRIFMAFIGGLIMGFGGMVASGCSIYYGISSISRFDVTGFVTFIFFFVGTVIINRIIYRG
ncbi:MAG: hypothetical protein RL017_780, partial [Pseudomonadota bacterium]